MADRDAALDVDLVDLLRTSVDVPLVLQGSSGMPDAGMVSVIRHGMTKINVATHLNRAFTTTVGEHLSAHPDLADTRTWFRVGLVQVEDETTRLLELYKVGA